MPIKFKITKTRKKLVADEKTPANVSKFWRDHFDKFPLKHADTTPTHKSESTQAHTTPLTKKKVPQKAKPINKPREERTPDVVLKFFDKYFKENPTSIAAQKHNHTINPR